LPRWKEEAVKQEKPYFNHIVESKDTLSGLAKKYSISIAEICQKNNLKKPYLLSLGKNLTIRNTKKPKTLASVSPQGKLELMKKLNPQIKDANVLLPSLKEFPAGIKIRFPKE
jgi:LysM repeat protein